MITAFADSLSLKSESQQVFSGLQDSSLVDLHNAVDWMVSARPLISNLSGLISKPFGTVPSASITIGITVTLMLHNFYLSDKV